VTNIMQDNSPLARPILIGKEMTRPKPADLWHRFFGGDYGGIIDVCQAEMKDACELIHLQGLCLVKLGHVEEGAARLRAAAILPPEHPNRWANATIAFVEGNFHEQAAEFGRETTTRFPDFAGGHFVYGNALLAAERWAEAAAAYRTTLELDPTFNDARLNLGNAYRRMFDLENARLCYNAVLQAEPNRQDAMVNLASLMLTEDQPDTEAMVDRARAVGPYPLADFMKSLIMLQRGDYINGWSLYRSRHRTPMALADSARWKRPVPSDRTEWHGKRVLILHEQGYGDSLQFCRYTPFVQQHASETMLMAPPALHRLFKDSFPGVTVVADRPEMTDYDYEIPMLDLPYHHTTTVETIPDAMPYLRVSREVHRLPPAQGVRVGVVWAGQSRPDPTLREIDSRRSTTLATFAPLATVPGIEWYSLQLGAPMDQVNSPPEGMTIKRILTNYEEFDFSNTGSVIEQLDLVISVDTSAVHLVGGLAKPIWVLSRFDGCWRWLKREDSPWYPTARVFHQKTPGDWATLMETEVLPALRTFVQEYQPAITSNAK